MRYLTLTPRVITGCRIESRGLLGDGNPVMGDIELNRIGGLSVFRTNDIVICLEIMCVAVGIPVSYALNDRTGRR
jgi:hypothetical protein